MGSVSVRERVGEKMAGRRALSKRKETKDEAVDFEEAWYARRFTRGMFIGASVPDESDWRYGST